MFSESSQNDHTLRCNKIQRAKKVVTIINSLYVKWCKCFSPSLARVSGWGEVPPCGPRPGVWSWCSPQAGPSSLPCSSGSSGCWAGPAAGVTWAAGGSALFLHCPPPSLQPGSDPGFHSHPHLCQQGSATKERRERRIDKRIKNKENN